jgi:hypothetical protein
MPRVKFGPAQPDWSSGAVLDREWLAEPLLQSLGGQSPLVAPSPKDVGEGDEQAA